MAPAAGKSVEKGPKKDRVSVSQTLIPSYSLERAVAIAQGLWDNFAGKSAPHELAIALDFSVASSAWRVVTGAALAYGLTTGAYNSKEIALTPLGKRIVAPTVEGDDRVAKVEAALKPTLLRDFFAKYEGAKFPKEDVAKNVLISLGLPKERADAAFPIVLENGRYAGLLRETKTGLFVFAQGGTVPAPASEQNGQADEGQRVRFDVIEGGASLSGIPLTNPDTIRRVFITHGKNVKILEQIKEIVRYGKFEPVVAIEHETVSKPVPEKVMDDMRSCGAAIIHVANEGVLADSDGKLIPQINGNVLIEIGAAMALYRRRFILLVEEGVQLPTNLQGLYECRYKGDSLDGFATMRLLKAFNDFS